MLPRLFLGRDRLYSSSALHAWSIVWYKLAALKKFAELNSPELGLLRFKAHKSYFPVIYQPECKCYVFMIIKLQIICKVQQSISKRRMNNILPTRDKANGCSNRALLELIFYASSCLVFLAKAIIMLYTKCCRPFPPHLTRYHNHDALKLLCKHFFKQLHNFPLSGFVMVYSSLAIRN